MLFLEGMMVATPLPELLKRPIVWKNEAIDPTVRRVLHSLQANIFKGHGREHTQNLFWSFENADMGELRSVVRRIGRRMPSALEQLESAERFKATGQSGGPVICFMLRPGGYEALGAANRMPQDSAFAAGLKARGAGLQDPPPTSWQKEFQGEIDAFLLIAADSDTEAQDEASRWRKRLTDAGATLLHTEFGKAQKRKVAEKPEGVEHFGYVDGRSQPLLLAEDVDREPRSFWDPAFPPSQFLVDDPGDEEETSLGSFFVFRKLEQNVQGFKEKEAALATDLGLNDGPFAERAGALLVGRFEDGSPVVLDPLPTDMPPVNDFDFRHDPDGSKCPFIAHIRKTNPRGESPFHLAQAGFATTVRQERGHIMARRGITYGERTFDEAANDFSDRPTGGVGLLFMAYMASLENQFEFTQSTWANNPGFVTGGVGVDPVIGQEAPGDPVAQILVSDGWGSGNAASFDFGRFVTMMGGEYFFAPSRQFLKSV